MIGAFILSRACRANGIYLPSTAPTRRPNEAATSATGHSRRAFIEQHADGSACLWFGGDRWIRLLLIMILGAALASSARAAAEDGPECFSKFTKFNVCEKAREAQVGLAATLPMKMNANITMSTAIVSGPRLVITAIW